MEKRLCAVFVLLLTSVILSACKPSQAELDAQATEIAANIFATQTAEAPPPTAISTATSTPTPVEEEIHFAHRPMITNQTIGQIELLAKHDYLHPVSAIAFHPTSELFAYVVNGSVRFFDVNLMQTGERLEGEYGYLTQITWAPDGEFMAGYDIDGMAWLFDPHDWEEIIRLGDEEDNMFFGSGLAMSPDGNYLAWISAGNTLNVWDVTENKSVLTETYEDSVWNLSWSPDARYIAVDQAKSVTLIDPFTGDAQLTFKGTDEYLASSPVWSPDSKQMAMADYTDLLVWDVDQEKRLNTLRGHTKQVDVLAWSPDGSVIASGSFDTTVRLWDPATGRSLAVFREPKDRIEAISFSPDGSLLVAGTSYGQLLIWGMKDTSEITEAEQMVTPSYPETVQDPSALLALEDKVVVLQTKRDEAFGIPDIAAWAVPWLALAMPGQVGLEPVEQACVWFISEESDGRVAIVYELGTGICEEPVSGYLTNKVILALLSWPDLELTEIVNIAAFYQDIESFAAVDEDTKITLISAMMAAAVSYPQWSPDGRYLAFVGAIEGPSSDLYLYDSHFDTVLRKTDGPNHAIMPSWSPDGSGILHQSVIYYPDPAQEALWWMPLYAYSAVKIQDSEWEDGGMALPIDWVEDSKLLYLFFDRSNGVGSLIEYDVSSYQSQIVVDRAKREGVKLPGDDGATYLLTETSVFPQTSFQLNLWNAETEEIIQTPLMPAGSGHPIGLPPFEQFLAVSDQGLARIQLDGDWKVLDPKIKDATLLISPDERMVLVVEMPAGPVWLYEFWESGEVRTSLNIYDEPLANVKDVEWRPDGKAVLVACNVEESYFAVPPEWTTVKVQAGCPAWHGWLGYADNSNVVSLIDVGSAVSEDTTEGGDAVDSVAVVYTRSFRPDYGGLIVLGQVTNNGSKPVAFVDIEVVLRDADDFVIDTKKVFAYTNVLFPGETAPFKGYFSDGPLFDKLEVSVVDYDEILAEDDYILRSNHQDLEVLQQNVKLERVGRYVITGELRNGGSNSATAIDVIATAYNSRGELVGLGIGWPAAWELAPGETSTFKVEFSVDGEVAEFKVNLKGNVVGD